ncbi:MAG: branched-chain amino acid ABC transporter permease, partial [Deltaproteobacteria bacterium]
MVFLYVILAESWNIIGGFAGYLSFGHVAFFGLGAYTTAFL